MVNFIEEYVKLIVKKPDIAVVKEIEIDKDNKTIEIYVDYEDMGKIIGRQGQMLKSLSVFIASSKAKGMPTYKLSAKNIDELC